MFLDISFFFLSYLIGSFPSAYLVLRWTQHNDIRLQGSKNVGALNVYRVSRNKMAGLLVLMLDLLKGLLPAWYVTVYYGNNYPLLWIVMLGLLLGHAFPVWLKFHGGRGLAVSAGALLIIQPLLVGIWMLVWLIFFAIIRKHIVASLIATFALPLIVFFMLGIFFTKNILILILIVATIIFQRHLERIPDLVEDKRKAIAKEVNNGN